jgi:molecular chaperone DnaJ
MGFRFFQRAPEPANKRDIAYAQILGVPLGVDARALRDAYLKLARRYHPDRNPEGATRMALLNEAYGYLRRRYAERSA